MSKQCDILFYEEFREVEFSQNNDVYSLSPIAFAKDGSGGEYVIIEDVSMGFIGSERQVGRVAESLNNLLTFFMLVLSQIFPVVCSIITSICFHNSVKDLLTKHEKTISQKVKIGIK